MDEELNERLKTIGNLCLISILLIREKRDDLLPTILEELHFKTQVILDKYCIKE